MLGDLVRGPGPEFGPAESGGPDGPGGERPDSERADGVGAAGEATGPYGGDQGTADDVDGPAAAAPARSRMARRRRALLAVAAASALVACGGLGAATMIKSPAERAAGTAPPHDTLLTAPAALRVLTRSTVTRGLVYPPTRYDVTPAAASADITRLYVSRLSVAAGDPVANGQQLAEVSGQPLFVLAGAVPAYRDIRPGTSGPDVTQLQTALAALGHDRGSDAEGTYGPGTARAVTAFYRALGYPAPTAGPTAQQAVDAAQQAVDADLQAVDALQARAAAPAAASPTATATAGADGAGTTVDGAGTAGQLDDARRKLADDRQALARAQEANGPVVPVGELVFLPVLPAAVTAVNASVGAPVPGPLLSLTSGALAVTGQLTPAQATGITPGMAVEILSEATGGTAKGVVHEVGSPTTVPPAGQVIAIGGGAGSPAPAGGAGNPDGGAPGSGPAAGGAQPGPAYLPLRIDPAEPLPAGFSGQNVRITVEREATAAPVLSVPVAAVYTEASGRTAVTRVDGAGRRITVPVTTGVDADGFVAVTPVDAAKLQPGDQVVVGR
ncbi:peptidoglycan-binding protein [Kitasatospora paranensis]|uniref:peptidoglycan-binding protein n=1 Tax=Kitasatospora paranensis TaxID=258053 RepID=UPI0031EC8536